MSVPPSTICPARDLELFAFLSTAFPFLVSKLYASFEESEV
jgi:hypothetical protein